MRLLGPLPSDVLEVVSDMTGFTPEQLHQPNGSARLKQAKHIVCWVSKQFGASYLEIASDLSRHHTTVMDSVRLVERNSNLMALAMDVAEVVRDKFGLPPSPQPARTEVEA